MMLLKEYLDSTNINLSNYKKGVITFEIFKNAYVGSCDYTKITKFLCKNLGLEEPSTNLSGLINIDDNYLGRELRRCVITLDGESDELRLIFKVVVK